MRQSTLFLTGLMAGFMVVSAAGAARAQFVPGSGPAGEGQISATGIVHLQRPPTHLRMFLQLTGKGKTLEEALAALKERRETVAAQLEKMGVDKKALVFAPPVVDESVNAARRRMEAMVAQRMGRGAEKGAKPVKPPVAVTAMLTAQWPLAGATPEKLLLAADAVHEKVKAAELGGGKETIKLTPEEQEVAEEMAAENARNNGNEEEQGRPGEPRFMFVARLAPQDRQTALADAFAKAKAQAAELAKAAGAALGPMRGLSGGPQGERGYNRYSAYNSYSNRGENEFWQQVAQASAADEQEGEAIGPKPDGIGFDFTVFATFALEAGKK